MSVGLVVSVNLIAKCVYVKLLGLFHSGLMLLWLTCCSVQPTWWETAAEPAVHQSWTRFKCYTLNAVVCHSVIVEFELPIFWGFGPSVKLGILTWTLLRKFEVKDCNLAVQTWHFITRVGRIKTYVLITNESFSSFATTLFELWTKWMNWFQLSDDDSNQGSASDGSRSKSGGSSSSRLVPLFINFIQWV